MKTLISLIFLFTINAQANFSGQWSGEFSFTNKKGVTYICDELIININQQTATADFGKFSYICGEFIFSYTPPTLNIEGEKIYFKNQYNNGEVGFVSKLEAAVDVIINDKKGRDFYSLKKVSDNEIEYSYKQIDIDPDTAQEVVVTSVRASLKRNQ